MQSFRSFDTNKKAAFLNKTKALKSKREEEGKRNKAVLKLQKNIRAFLTAARHAGANCLLLLRHPTEENLPHVEKFWNSPQEFPHLVQGRMVITTIKYIKNGTKLTINQANFLRTLTSPATFIGQLFEKQYAVLIDRFLPLIVVSTMGVFLQHQNFRRALQKHIGGDLHKLADIITAVQDHQIVRGVIALCQSPHSLQDEGEAQPSEQRILKSYFGLVSLYSQSGQGQSEDSLVQLLSTMMLQMKEFYTRVILHKYKIDRGMYESPQFKEEVEEAFREKKEWEEYESHLHHLLVFIPHILTSYLSKSSRSIQAALTLIIEATRLSHSVMDISISKDDFFVLLEKLADLSPHLVTQNVNKYSQILFVVIVLEKYLEGINDLRFIGTYQYDASRLEKHIRGYLLKYLRAMVNLKSQLKIVNEIVRHSISLVNDLYNKSFRTALIRTTVFEDSSLVPLTYNIHNKNLIKELQKTIERMPYLLPIETRFYAFRNCVIDNYRGHHGGHHVTIHRGKEFEDAFRQLNNRDLKGSLRVKFINELGQEQIGIDAQGLTKQFLTRTFKTAFDPKFGMFVENAKRELMPNPKYQKINDGETARVYEFIGKLIGKSLIENILLGTRFAGPFLNLLINKRNTFDDLLQIDPDLYKSLEFIVNMTEGVQELELTFQYQDTTQGKSVNLIRGGDRVKVTKRNKMEYIKLLIDYKVNRSFDRQTHYIRRGLRSMISERLFEMFNFAELNYLLSGTGIIDVRDWRVHTNVHGNSDKGYIDSFWAMVGSFSELEKSLLLKFVTSCQRPSVLGFQDLRPPFTIMVTNAGNETLPVSHTCSNILELPLYSTPQRMREKVLYAIKSASGFELA